MVYCVVAIVWLVVAETGGGQTLLIAQGSPAAHGRFMFPIEDGSRSEYNVLDADVAELRDDADWLARYRYGQIGA